VAQRPDHEQVDQRRPGDVLTEAQHVHQRGDPRQDDDDQRPEPLVQPDRQRGEQHQDQVHRDEPQRADDQQGRVVEPVHVEGALGDRGDRRPHREQGERGDEQAAHAAHHEADA